MEAGGESHEGLVAGRGVAVAHFLEGGGDGAVLQTAVSSDSLVGVAFGGQRDNFAVALVRLRGAMALPARDLPSPR
jgi:hypothetical protein